MHEIPTPLSVDSGQSIRSTAARDRIGATDATDAIDATGADDGPDAESRAGAPLIEFGATILRSRRLILALAIPVALATAIFCLVRPRYYTSASSFMPQSRRQGNAGLSALASQYGLAVPTGDNQNSPAFYSDLLASREILEQAADSQYAVRTPAGPRRIAVSDMFRVSERDSAVRREETIKELRKHIGSAVVQRSGIILLNVTAPDPDVAQQLNARLLALANAFNLETRKSQAKSERQFSELRLGEVRAELRVAEDRLQGFYQTNREYASSPSLTFQRDRLSREVEMARQLYQSLSQSVEQAKLDEVRETPVITVIDAPSRPLRPDPRGTILKTLFAFIIASVLGIFFALFRETMRRAVAGSQSVEIARLRRETWDDLLHPWRLLSRRSRREQRSGVPRP